MPRPKKLGLREEFANWLATPPKLRVSLNMPRSEREFGDVKGVNPSTLRRWKADEEFQRMAEKAKAELAKTSAVLVDEQRIAEEEALDGMSKDEQRYLQVKETLVGMATGGSQGAIDLYLKHYGKSFIEAEQAEFADYRDMSDEQLAAEVMALLGVEAVSSWLAEKVAAEV